MCRVTVLTKSCWLLKLWVCHTYTNTSSSVPLTCTACRNSNNTLPPFPPTQIRTRFKWGDKKGQGGGSCYVMACTWTASLLRGVVEGEPQTWAPTGKPALCPWCKYLWHLLSSHGSRVWRNGRVRNGAGQPGWHLYPSTGHHL